MPQYYARKVVVEKATIEEFFKGIYNPVNFKVKSSETKPEHWEVECPTLTPVQQQAFQNLRN